MAAETFLKISKLTKHMFTQQNESSQPYVIDLINMIPENCKDLESNQRLQVYEGIGYMISTAQQSQPQLIQMLLQYVNAEWTIIINSAQQNIDSLMNPQVIKSLDHIIKVNQRVAQSVGQAYLSYLHGIFNDLINVYKLYSQCISNSIRKPGHDSVLKPMKQLRRDILKLIQTYIEKETDFNHFNNNFLPSL